MGSLAVDVALGRTGAALVSALGELPEDQWFDRKSGRVSAKDLARPLIAFANAEGGTLVVGIHGGTVDGVSPQLINSARQVPLDFTVPPVRATFETIPVEAAELLVIRIEPGDTIHTNRAGECFLRIGDESRKLSLAEQQELTYDRGGRPFEATPAEIEPTDLSGEQTDAYRTAIGSASVREMLAARDLLSRRGRLTVAAQLLFDDHPQTDFPSAYVRVLTYDTDDAGVGATMSLTGDTRIDGSLPHQIIQASTAIDSLLPHRQQLQPSGRFERVPIIPRDAWLEGLVNAVVHRSYSMMGDHVRVSIFPHRVEISSPGRFPGLVDPSKPLQIARYARNPRIARVCADMGITRELGEGIKRIFQEMQARGLADPLYRQTASSVCLVLSSADAVDPAILARLSKSAHKVLTTMRIARRPLGTGQVADLAEVTRPTAGRALQELSDVGLVVWEGASPRDPRASWRLL